MRNQIDWLRVWNLPVGYISSLYSDLPESGKADNLTINTRELLVRDGAEVDTRIYGAAKGGNLVVNADSVELIGSTANGLYGSGLFSSSYVTSDRPVLYSFNSYQLPVISYQFHRWGKHHTKSTESVGVSTTTPARESVTAAGTVYCFKMGIGHWISAKTSSTSLEGCNVGQKYTSGVS